MRVVIVLNQLRDSIYEKIDSQLENLPHLKEKREEIYNQLLNYYDDHGIIPDFNIEPVVTGSKPVSQGSTQESEEK